MTSQGTSGTGRIPTRRVPGTRSRAAAGTTGSTISAGLRPHAARGNKSENTNSNAMPGATVTKKAAGAAAATSKSKTTAAAAAAPTTQINATSTATPFLDRLRSWRNTAWEQSLWPTAAYWGDKILTIGGEADDYYRQAKIYFATQEYGRTESLLSSRKDILDASIRCRYMAALCATKLGKWDEAEDLLRPDTYDRGEQPREGTMKYALACLLSTYNVDSAVSGDEDKQFAGPMWYLAGIVQSQIGQMTRAKDCMKKAVLADPRSMEAFKWLAENHALDLEEEKAFVRTIDFSQCGEDASFMALLYQSNTRVYDEHKVVQLETTYKLKGNHDMLQRRADAMFERCKYAQCYELTSAIVKQDPHNAQVVPVHISAMMELGYTNDLFYFAHWLVDNFPERASTWFAVGTYYLMIKKNLEARKYFSKATQMNGSFGPGWLGFAHSFAAEGETDQAISAYATAAKLFNGMHLPLMYLGMHYINLQNFDLAREYLLLAESINKTDPILMNELGVLHLKFAESMPESGKINYTQAIEYFERALKLAEEADYANAQWATTWYNLAQAHRKAGNIDQARRYLRMILDTNRNVADAHILLGYLDHYEGKWEDAAEHYQRALSYKPDDDICKDLLQEAVTAFTREAESKWPALPPTSKDFFLPPDMEKYRHLQDPPEEDLSMSEEILDPGPDDADELADLHDGDQSLRNSSNVFAQPNTPASLMSAEEKRQALLRFPNGFDTTPLLPQPAWMTSTYQQVSSIASSTSSTSSMVPSPSYRGPRSLPISRRGLPSNADATPQTLHQQHSDSTPNDPVGLTETPPNGTPAMSHGRTTLRRSARHGHGPASSARTPGTPGDGDVSMDMEIDEME
ncbi:uncharacterized protein EV422DRAFT_121460 [Fimicolochytrium jonesii]|uniref:uncharacterized protein n=1 Tax=Fimicolochytrium jonesii TaxID=1396493 RepID=UPI0022FE189B|nr:uncharacterized protein EV422DRAFT_121460 [Fimicolochytrium jonesii]KAI8819214.1 hypothetical protein EV422DRAFT_121460 [Fimicolochytrium jonesii]